MSRGELDSQTSQGESKARIMKKVRNFFKKPLDKWHKVCYNKYVKRGEQRVNNCEADRYQWRQRKNRKPTKLLRNFLLFEKVANFSKTLLTNATKCAIIKAQREGEQPKEREAHESEIRLFRQRLSTARSPQVAVYKCEPKPQLGTE